MIGPGPGPGDMIGPGPGDMIGPGLLMAWCGAWDMA